MIENISRRVLPNGDILYRILTTNKGEEYDWFPDINVVMISGVYYNVNIKTETSEHWWDPFLSQDKDEIYLYLHKHIEGDARAKGESVEFKIIKEEEMYDYIK